MGTKRKQLEYCRVGSIVATKHSEPAVPSTGTTTILSLKDMVAAPDDRQSWPPTLSQLREPVLDLELGLALAT